jgi:hypothetical protein
MFVFECASQNQSLFGGNVIRAKVMAPQTFENFPAQVPMLQNF